MSKPNLLFMLTDEQRTDTMAAYGNTLIERCLAQKKDA